MWVERFKEYFNENGRLLKCTVRGEALCIFVTHAGGVRFSFSVRFSFNFESGSYAEESSRNFELEGSHICNPCRPGWAGCASTPSLSILYAPSFLFPASGCY